MHLCPQGPNLACKTSTSGTDVQKNPKIHLHSLFAFAEYEFSQKNNILTFIHRFVFMFSKHFVYIEWQESYQFIFHIWKLSQKVTKCFLQNHAASHSWREMCLFHQTVFVQIFLFMNSCDYQNLLFIFPLSLFFPLCSRHSTKENCCHFSAGTVIHWGVMDGNEAALRILFSKDLCKAISNVLLKTNIALKKKELKVFGLWTFSDKITQKKLALPASLTPHHQASFSSASAYPHCQQPHLHACSVNQQHTH